MNVGQVVKFREVLEAGDENRRFRVVELRGERVLVEDLTDRLQGWIQPTRAFLAAELIEA